MYIYMYIDPLGVNEMLYNFLEIMKKFPMNLISMLFYDGGLLCMEYIEIFLEKLWLLSKI